MNNTTNTTNSTTTPTNAVSPATSTRRHRVTGLLLAAGAVALLTFTGCSAAQRRALGEQDVHDSLASHVERVISDRSLAIGNRLDCSSTIDADSHVSASCAGATSSGSVIKATYVGTADVNAETCTAVLAVDIDGTRIVEQPYVQCFKSV